MKQAAFIGPRQIKAARALLEWSQENLATETRLSIGTIRKLELGYISPRTATTEAIRNVFEDSGLEFIEPEGVRRRPEEIVTYQGSICRVDFLQDVQLTLQKTGGEAVMVETSQEGLNHWLKAGICQWFPLLLETTPGATIKCLLTELIDVPDLSSRLEFRFISKQYVDSMPFCVYGDKFAVISTNKIDDKIIAMRTPSLAQASRRQFFSMWDKATPMQSEGLEAPKLRARAG